LQTTGETATALDVGLIASGRVPSPKGWHIDCDKYAQGLLS